MHIKHFLLIGALLCSVFAASAQDVITKTDGSTIQAKVDKITETSVEYHRFDHLSGPIYSIPLSSIAKIVYEGGVTDIFSPQPAEPQQSIVNTVSKTELNEAQLRRIALTEQYDDGVQTYLKRANRYRKTAWIGGGVLLLAGGVTVLAMSNDEYEDTYMYIAGAGFLAGGAIWCTAWNLAANHQKKLARQAALYSAAIFEEEVLQIGKTNLNVSMNSMYLPATHTQGLGIGLTLNF